MKHYFIASTLIFLLTQSCTSVKKSQIEDDKSKNLFMPTILSENDLYETSNTLVKNLISECKLDINKDSIISVSIVSDAGLSANLKANLNYIKLRVEQAFERETGVNFKRMASTANPSGNAQAIQVKSKLSVQKITNGQNKYLFELHDEKLNCKSILEFLRK